MCPEPLTRRLRTTGPRESPAGNSGWKIKPEKIKGEACGKDATMQPRGLRVAGEGRGGVARS